MKKAVDFLKELMFNRDNEREYLIAQIAMKRYAAMKCDEQKKMIWEYIDMKYPFNNQNDQRAEMYALLTETGQPIFD